MGLWRRSRSPARAAQEAYDHADVETAKAARASATAQLWRELAKYAEAATMSDYIRKLKEENHFSDMIMDVFGEGDERHGSDLGPR